VGGRVAGAGRDEVLETVRGLFGDEAAADDVLLRTVVLGPLAEQHQPGVTVRVLGLQRTPYATRVAIELADEGAGEVRLKHAYGLVDSQTFWKRLSAGPPWPPESGKQSQVVSVDGELDSEDAMLALALDVRTASGKRPFVLRVPLARPEELVPQRAPQRLPPLRGSWPRHLLWYAVFTAAMAWWSGWFAIVVPLYLAGAYYVQVRSADALPRRLHPIRHLLDVAVPCAIFIVLWESPAVNWAVPSLVAAVVYVLLRWLVPRLQPTARLATAVTVGIAWLFLLGTSTGRLSPCRLTGAAPSSAALSFAHDVYANDLPAAVGMQYGHEFPHVGPLITKGLIRAAGGSDLTFRSPHPTTYYCRVLLGSPGVQRCYEYGPTGLRPALRLWIGVGCDGKDWRVYGWL
jgi:hypothetical protein